MALRGKKPENIEKRLKMLIYGKSGVGKTYTSLHFPSPYLIDCESGSEHQRYVDLLTKNNGLSFETYEADELISEVKELLAIDHQYKTLIIDPLTIIYDDLVDKAMTKLLAKNSEEPAYNKHYFIANKYIKRLLMLIYRLDMNVIIISHEKIHFNTKMETFDCYKKLDYACDLVLEVQLRGTDNRVAIVRKSRIEGFPYLTEFPFNYDEIATRYGRDILEKTSEREVLACKDEVDRLNSLIKIMKIPEEITDKWLTKSNSTQFSEMKSEDIKKCIQFLESKLEN